jgi:hypothetical protein
VAVAYAEEMFKRFIYGNCSAKLAVPVPTPPERVLPFIITSIIYHRSATCAALEK